MTTRPADRSALVLGVDAGNSKTIAIVARSDGRIVGWGRSGCGDIYGAGERDALDAIAAASHAALRVASVGAGAVSAVVLSAAGADWPEDFDAIRAGAVARGLGPNPIVYNDAIGGLRAGSPDGTGVSVVCGTGAATGARSRDGRIWHSSFWQVPQGAQQLGHLVLQTVVQAELGIVPPTALTPALLRHLNAPTVEVALHALTARSAPSRPDVKSLAKLLLDVAAMGDRLAVALVAAHGRALGDVALAAARRVGLIHEPFYLVLIGGVFRHPSPVLRDAVAARVREDAPDVNVIHATFEPAVGAVMLALEHIGIAITPQVRATLQATAPPAGIFTT